MPAQIVVIGAGQAAIAFAAKLRELDNDCNISLIGADASLPYQRPPLSKKYLLGELERERLLLRPAPWYQAASVTCLTSRSASAVLPDRKEVRLDDGTSLPFDKLVFATGAAPRLLPPAMGGESGDVFVLRSMADADAIAPRLAAGARMLVIGGGYIGLEVAAVAAKRGLAVTIVEMAERILQRVAAPATSDLFRELHVKNGVEILENTSIGALADLAEGGIGAAFSDGSERRFDFALAAIGVTPNTALAAAAGLETDNGICVDAHTVTSHPDIHAAGDCASFEFGGRRIRLESVQNAIDQGEAAARNIAGERCEYRPVPWFWSDQYDAKLQIAGLHMGYDRTVSRPGSHAGGQSVWYFAGDHFVAVDALNDPRAYMTGKRLLEQGANPTPAQVADPAFDLRSLMQ
jgi:3-phenylpropionate/trans-cinnamate dioxygenase ferredoxin reductase component